MQVGAQFGTRTMVPEGPNMNSRGCEPTEPG